MHSLRGTRLVKSLYRDVEHPFHRSWVVVERGFLYDPEALIRSSSEDNPPVAAPDVEQVIENRGRGEPMYFLIYPKTEVGKENDGRRERRQGGSGRFRSTVGRLG